MAVSAAGRRMVPLVGSWLDPVGVEFEEIVGGRDESPFRPRGGPASSHEPVAPAVVFDLAEGRLDSFAGAVERLPSLGAETPAHERIEPAVPAGPGPVAQAAVG